MYINDNFVLSQGIRAMWRDSKGERVDQSTPMLQEGCPLILADLVLILPGYSGLSSIWWATQADLYLPLKTSL